MASKPKPILVWTPDTLISEVEAIITQELQREGGEAIDEIRSKFSRGVSSPGRPPGVQSGKLSRGLQFVVLKGRRTLLFGVDTSVTYALALEMGAPSIGLRARPFLRPQRMRSKRRLTKRLAERFNQ